MPTLGARIESAKVSDLRRVLADLDVQDFAQLDPALGEALSRPLGRELLAARLPLSDSVFVCLYNLEPAGLVVAQRSHVAARVRALAVAPDLRRRGLARSMLAELERRVYERGLGWLWMRVPSANVAGTKCALACGFRRYRPQFLQRNLASTLPADPAGVEVEPLAGRDAEASILKWLNAEVESGDAWAKDVVLAELLPLFIPQQGEVWRCEVAGAEAGCVHVAGLQRRRVLSLWMAREYWDTPAETACLKAVLNKTLDVPTTIDLYLGSEGHLRAAVGRYKALGMRPVLDEWVVMVKKLSPPA